MLLRGSILILFVCALCAGLPVYSNGELRQHMSDMKALSKAPTTYNAPEYGPKGEKVISGGGLKSHRDHRDILGRLSYMHRGRRGQSLQVRDPRSPRTLYIRLEIPHGHGGAGENPDEIHAFADSVCTGAKPLVKITKQGIKGRQMWANYTSRIPVNKAELIFTCDTGKWQDRKWKSVPAAVNGSRVTAEIPDGTQVCYMNLIDARGLVVSTEHADVFSN